MGKEWLAGLAGQQRPFRLVTSGGKILEWGQYGFFSPLVPCHDAQGSRSLDPEH